MKWQTVKNPRKENGDLGDIKCDLCHCKSGAYILISGISRICMGCLEDGIEDIKNTILSDII